MYSSAIVYSVIAKALHGSLSGLQLSACFSNTREELILHFEGNVRLQLCVRFAGGEMFFFCEPISVYQGRNAINQFRSLENQILSAVEVLPGERAFRLKFNDGQLLYFKGYGKFGNALLYQNQALPETIFRKELKADLEKNIESFHPVFEPVVFPINDEKQVKNAFPWFTAEVLLNLHQVGFYAFSSDEQDEYLNTLTETLLKGQFYINNQTDPPSLLVLPQLGADALPTGQEGLETFARKYLQRFYFLDEKNRRLQQLRQKVKHLQKLLQEQTRRLDAIETRRSYKELGDIILTYAHTIKPGVTNAFLTDYFTGNQIRIKLDAALNAAGNAEKYYRKAKNEIMEKSKLQEDLDKTRKGLQTAMLALETIEKANDFKGLKGKELSGKTAQVLSAKQPDNKPYKLVQFEGYEIWIGKNAKGNDAMLKLAGKNDLWFHARGYAGSHIIVRRKGNERPELVIAYAARLAAENSKAKTQKIVPVYCVERKFVTKPKKADTGEVVVLKDTVVDAVLD